MGILVFAVLEMWKVQTVAREVCAFEVTDPEFRECVCDINNKQLLKLAFIGHNISLRVCFVFFFYTMFF